MISTTMQRMPPGRYSGSSVPETPVSPRMSFQPNDSDISKALKSGNTREATSKPARIRYGAQAIGTEIGVLPATSSIFISILPIHSDGHSLAGAKSQLSFGSRKPALAAGTTMARPTSAPIIDGNSGPRNTPAAAYGMTKARPVNTANGAIARPSVQDLLRPKWRVMMLTMISGMRIPHSA